MTNQGSKLDKVDKPQPRAVTKWIFMKPEDIVLRFNSVIRGILGLVDGKHYITHQMSKGIQQIMTSDPTECRYIRQASPD